jgi:hypothetical protein
MPNTNALMGMARVLKPFWRFEYWYDRVGEPALDGGTPIALFPTGREIPANGDPPAADPRAFDQAVINGDAGYAESLAAMLPMPQIGSDALIWIPRILCDSGEEDPPRCYIYVPVWRLRTVRDTSQYNKQGHIYKESFGADDYYILPAALAHVIVAKQEFDDASTNTFPAFLQVSTSSNEGIAMPASVQVEVSSMPISPNLGNPLTYEQGVLAANPYGSKPNYMPYWLKVMGDELGFWVYKALHPQPGDTSLTYVDWEFNYDPATGFCDTGAEDFNFSQLFGVGGGELPGLRPESGLYVMAGKGS